MTFPTPNHGCRGGRAARGAGFVLIIVLWVAIGLVSIALYFANSMSFELRAADNRVAGLAADEAIEGAARYIATVLGNLETNGVLPDVTTYQNEAVPVGDAYFWLIGRDAQQEQQNRLVFGLVDEASKLNLNRAGTNLLEALPGMTPELAGAIIDWRDGNEDISPNGAESQAYALLRPAYLCKNTNFESVAELRLIAGMTMDVLCGEDANFNGVLDLNENDGDTTLPSDNRDGRLDPGLLEYLTVYTREPNRRSDGSPRVDIRTPQSRTNLQGVLRQKFEQQRANQIMANIGQRSVQSTLEFYIRSGMRAVEFEQIIDDITASSGDYIEGLVNVNTASETVLACIPGIGTTNAGLLVAYRETNPDQLASVAWVRDALGEDNTGAAIQAGRYFTTRSYQFTADIAAVGPYGRGYRRTRFVFDTADGTPKILFRQDLSHLGWALGRDIRQQLVLAQTKR